MKIKNVKGSSKVSPNPPKDYQSWLEYWEKNKDFMLDPKLKYYCPGCKKLFLREDFDGCHVQKVDSDDQKWYVIPLCSGCNHRTEEMDVDENLLLNVPSNLNVTYKD